jgi:hypothetical protein
MVHVEWGDEVVDLRGFGGGDRIDGCAALGDSGAVGQYDRIVKSAGKAQNLSHF